MSTCIFPGRFQPFHTGQLMVVQGMVKTCDRVVVAVCTGNEGDIFSKDEVQEMISAALLAEDLVDVEILFVEDCEDAEWADKILDAAEVSKEEAQVWSGREEVLKAFEDAGVATKKITHVPGHESADIRKLIKDRDREWMSKVPAGAVDVVHKHLNGEG